MKRIFSLALCFALVLSLFPLPTRGEDLLFTRIQVDAGSGVCSETAIVQNGELYIPADHFSRYTRYRYHESSNLFLIKGQTAEKSIKPIRVSPEQKRLGVGTQFVNLSDCFTVDGVLYLPFCQMLPILNAEILAVEEGTILISNPPLSMAELLYDFQLSDYAYDLSAEFFDDDKLLLLYTIPSFLFDSVTNFRFDRLDVIADSGTYKDYKEIFEDYLKEDDLYFQATGQKDYGKKILSTITGVNSQSETLNDTMEWLERLAARDIAFTQSETINQILDRKGLYSGYFEKFGVDTFPVTKAVHDDTYFVSIADAFEILEYAYNYFNHVEDHFRMLDAVYDFSRGDDFDDTQRRGARAVYDLYGDREWYGVLKETADKLFEKALEESKYGGELVLYKLTAKLSGELWELVIPGDTSDISTLILHAGVASTAMVKAGGGSFKTEESTENYRLSLLLMMLASRRCYEIMADTAEGYGGYYGDYEAKIRRLETMIQGLYLVAGNVRLDTYEYFDDYAGSNRALLQDAGIFDSPEPAEPEDVSGPDETLYLDFLATHPEYHYYALLDVNQDGSMELLASADNGQPHSRIDLWVWDGEFRRELEDMWAKYCPLSYGSNNRWICEISGGTGGSGGAILYYLDENLSGQTTSIEWMEGVGFLFNGAEANSGALLDAWNAFGDKHASESYTDILLSPIPTR